MKIHVPKQLKTALAGLLSLTLTSSLALASLVLPTPAEQATFNPRITETVNPNPDVSFLAATLANVPPGYSITNTTYLDWCIDSDTLINPGGTYNPVVISSLDVANLTAFGVPALTIANLDKVNWIINNKPPGANALTIQHAIYTVLGQTGPGKTLIESNGFAGFGFANYNPAASAALVAAANVNGVGFVPGPGQVLGVVLELPAALNGGTMFQRNLIEVLVPSTPNLGSIGDTVYCDTNANGVQDPGELGLPGVQITLLGNTASGPVNLMATTDAQGKYLFTNLEAGTYAVAVNQLTAPPDCNRLSCPTTQVLNLAPGQNYLDADFCFAPKFGRIGDTVFCDVNGNGIQEPGDFGIPNVKVTLTILPGGATQTAFTDAQGKYLFTNLPAGDYAVSVDVTTLPANCDDMVPNCPVNRLVNLGLGQAFLDADFCFTTADCTLDVAAFCSIPQPPGDADDCDGSKIRKITMVYTAENCSASSNSMPADKATCTGVTTLDNTVFIKVTDKSNPNDSKAKVFFQGVVNKDDTYDISALGTSNLPTDTYIFIYKTDQTTLQQTVKFHTSCSQPIAAGDQFGANLIVEMTFADGRTTTIPHTHLDKHCTVTQSLAAICPDGGKVSSLQLIYTQEDCSFSANTQASGKWACTDFGALTPSVFILVTDKSSPTDSKAKKYFQGTVNVNDMFNVAASNAGASTLPANIFVHIYNVQGGTRLQALQIHTSCSTPLNAGDQFGSLIVFSAVTTNAGTISQGSEVKFTYLISNNGGSNINNVVVTDSFGTVPGSPIASLAPGQVVELTRTVTTTSDISNTVTAASPAAGCQDTDLTTVTIVPPPPTPKDCTSQIQKTLLTYTGPNVNGAVTVNIVGASGATASYNLPGGLLNGTTLSSPAQNGWTIDSTVSGETALGAKMTISINGVPELHHTSCSTPYRTGQPAPLDSPKGQPSTLWFVEDFVSKP